MSKFVVYFDKQGTKFNLDYQKVEGRNIAPYYRIRAELDKTGDKIGECVFEIKDKKNNNVYDFTKPAGFVEKPKRVCFLKKLAVEPKFDDKFFKQGVGSVLLKAMENVAVAQEANSINASDVMINNNNNPHFLDYSNLFANNDYAVSSYLVFKDDLERHTDIVAENVQDVEPLSDDDLHTL